MFKKKLLPSAQLAVILLTCAIFFLPRAQAGDIKISVKGMVCGFCAQGITKKFKAEPAVAKVDVSLETKLVTLSLKDGLDEPDDKIESILKEAGYNVEKITRTAK